jgi:hypothetical protein
MEKVRYLYDKYSTQILKKNFCFIIGKYTSNLGMSVSSRIIIDYYQLLCVIQVVVLLGIEEQLIISISFNHAEKK